MQRFLLAFLTGLCLACGLGASPAAAIEMPTYGRAFCRGTTLHDYDGVLEHMPPVRHVPENEDLPFGPRNMSIYQSAISHLIVGRGGFGYGFFDDTYGRRKQVRLDWDVMTRLWRIDRHGTPLQQVGGEEQHLGVVAEIDELSFWLDTPPGPSLYRYDIEFRDHGSGRLLGSYSEYLRVVVPTFHAGIAVNRRRFEAGQEAFARVENRGTSWLEFGLAYSVQRFEGGRWASQPLGSGVWPAIGLFMGGGSSGWCMRYRIPPDAAPGWYRFVKGLGFPGHGGRQARAAFRVGS